MVLYKYASLELAKKIILDNEIRFSQPGCLNDVFEMIPKFKNMIKDEYLIDTINTAKKFGVVDQIWEENLKKSYDNIDDASKKYFSKSEFEEFSIKYINHILKKDNKNLAEFILEKMKNNPNSFTNDFRINWLNVLNSYIGVFCLSKICDNELMWVNYSQNHTGVVLEFDVDHHFFNPLFKVEYENESPILDLSELENIEKDVFRYLNILKVKSTKWSYEEEYRTFKLLSQKDRIADNLDSLKFQIYLFKFPPHCLRGIIFGSRCLEESINDFKSIINNNLYRNLNLFKMIVDFETRKFKRIEYS